MAINDRFDEIKTLLEPLGFIPYYYDSLYNEHITKSINYDVYMVFMAWRDDGIHLYPSCMNTQSIILSDEIDLKIIEKAAKDFIKSTKDYKIKEEDYKMKEYFVAWYFLDQGMEGIPNLTPAFIIEAKDEQEAIKKYPKEIKKNMKGYGHICVLGKIKNDELLLEREYFNIRLIVEDLYKTAKHGNYRIL